MVSVICKNSLIFANMKTRHLFAISLSLILIFLLSSCRRNRLPEGVLDHETMVAFLTDAHMLESYYAVETDFHYELKILELSASYNELFDKHGVTREQVERSREYYLHHEREYKEIYGQVVQNLADAANGVKETGGSLHKMFKSGKHR